MPPDYVLATVAEDALAVYEHLAFNKNDFPFLYANPIEDIGAWAMRGEIIHFADTLNTAVNTIFEYAEDWQRHFSSYDWDLIPEVLTTMEALKIPLDTDQTQLISILQSLTKMQVAANG